MTIRFLQPWNGYQIGQTASLSAGVESSLKAAGLARDNYTQDGPVSGVPLTVIPSDGVVASIPGVLEKTGGSAPNLVTDITDSTVLDPASGFASSSAGWKTTGYMPVSPMMTYSASTARYICWYNSSKTKIGTSVDQANGAWNGQPAANAAFARITAYQGAVSLTFKGSDPPQSILTVDGEQIATLVSTIKGWFITSTYTPSGAITRNAGGKITTPKTIRWPDGATGTLNVTYNADWTVQSANATYVGAGGFSCTVTQPAITYDANGWAINIPDVVVS